MTPEHLIGSRVAGGSEFRSKISQMKPHMPTPTPGAPQAADVQGLQTREPNNTDTDDWDVSADTTEKKDDDEDDVWED
jgi:hypothetical protein